MNKFALCCIAIVSVTLSLAIGVNSEIGNELIDANYPPPAAGRTWTDTAKQFMAGPGGQFAVNIAKEMISRSAGNSQILSLNLSNLLVLFLLKALIFAAGLLGANNWSQYGRGRSEDSGDFFEFGEVPLYIGYLAAEGSGQDGCLSRAACRSPNTAYEYAKAARSILKGSELFNASLQYNPRYNQIIQSLEDASVEGKQGAPCDMIYSCRI